MNLSTLQSNDDEELEHIQDDFEPETKVVEEQCPKRATKRRSFASQSKVPPNETKSAGKKNTFKTLQNLQLHVARVHEGKKAHEDEIKNILLNFNIV